jgi:hypothetical protein
LTFWLYTTTAVPGAISRSGDVEILKQIIAVTTETVQMEMFRVSAEKEFHFCTLFTTKHESVEF